MRFGDIIKLINMEGYYMGKLYKRELYLSKIRPFYKDEDMIKVLTGVRRCGKSSIMQLICNELIENGIRCEIDLRDEKMNYKLRESIIKKYPITLILGDKEKDNENISYRRYGSEETITVSIDEFIALINDTVKERRRNVK